MIRNELSTCDFFWGRLYIDFFCRPDIYEKAKWDEWLAKCPNFKAFGERFKTANMNYISKRIDRPF